MSLEEEIRDILPRSPEVTVAVVVRDMQTNIAINADRSFHAASTMKVPVMIEVYRRVARGDMALDDELPVENAFHSIVDGSVFSIVEDSDDALYDQLGQTMSLGEMVHRMITVSSNLATNLVIEAVSADSVQKTALELGASRIKVLRGVEDLKAYDLGQNNTTTARDLAVLLNALAQGNCVSPESDSVMIDVLLDAAFNEMIPEGLPGDVRVAHKTGEITHIHHDAAIVYPAQRDPYVLVILIEGIDDRRVSAALGADIARTVHARLRG